MEIYDLISHSIVQLNSRKQRKLLLRGAGTLLLVWVTLAAPIPETTLQHKSPPMLRQQDRVRPI